MGNNFYKDGKLMNRMNTFDDVNKVAEYFVRKGYSVNLEGRSAGGLMSAASSILRPELYTSVLCIVPFVDVLVTMADETIPLTIGEWSEVGNTNIDSIFKYVKKYSPVHNIESNVEYPNYYVTGGFNDPRVNYWEPVKFVAKMRHALRESEQNTLQNSDDYSDCEETENLILLRIDFGSGHFGASERYKNMETTAEKYAFLIKTNE